MKSKFKKVFGGSLVLGAVVVLAAACGGASSSNLLDDIIERGHVNCGIAGDLAGFSAPTPGNYPIQYGEYAGIDAEVCYALAAAVFGDPTKVEFVRLTTTTRFSSLASGEVDVLSRNTTHTLSRDTSVEDSSGGLEFTFYNFIDGQGFLVRKDLGVSSATELNRATVCVQSGTTTELNLQSYFGDNGMTFTAKNIITNDEAKAGLNDGSCEVYTTDKSGLAATLSTLNNPGDFMILGETISKEPLGPVVPSPTSADDTEWKDLVYWTGMALINAEELGITSSNASTMATAASSGTNVKLILGSDGDMCTGINSKLSSDCFLQAIKAVGNYGELYERTVGADTPLGLSRTNSPNDLPSRGGALYSPPIR